MISIIRTIGLTFLHLFRRRATVRYPEEKIALPARWRGRIILSRDPGGGERCVACYLCAVACPVGCIALQAAEEECVDLPQSVFSCALLEDNHTQALAIQSPQIPLHLVDACAAAADDRQILARYFGTRQFLHLQQILEVLR